ncbi:MAG TPA: UDP-glucose/GDP-mannose dehydrogenase family protein [Dermatophilaceae bacterium]|nr:UDP-glucose/GDP-mannose dehydrogenase family protein [Dermatophilaceae bacterium]
MGSHLLSVIGAGYLGTVHAACLAALGHRVVAVDVDEAKIAALAAGRAPMFEPGLDELLARVLPTGRLRFTTDIAEAADAAAHFICVGTPQRVGENRADTTAVFAAVDALAPHLRSGSLLVGKSTVPVGTACQLRERAQATAPAGSAVGLAWNPEFLREGFAIEDTLRPNRFVYGVEGPDAEADVGLLDSIYADALAQGIPRLVLDYSTAELVKTAANAFLATKISFINAMSEVCESAGGDVVALAEAIGLDDRIGPKFLRAGLGFGGGCLPKDIRAFMARAGELGADQALTFLREVDQINLRRRSRMVDLARHACGGTLRTRRVAVLGLAFKPHSDDIRDSPALDVARVCRDEGAAEVRVHDPKAMPNARRVAPELTFADSVEDAVSGAHVVLHLTEWPEYQALDPVALRELVSRPMIIDGRNALDPGLWQRGGWVYRALGRPHI